MAYVFEMRVGFETRLRDAEAFSAHILSTSKPIQVGHYSIGLHPPKICKITIEDMTFIAVSIIPKNVGYSYVFDSGPRLPLKAAEMHFLATEMYNLVRGYPHVYFAYVSWEYSPYRLAEVIEDFGEYDGLVIANDALPLVPADHRHCFQQFDEFHLWIPPEPLAYG